MHHVCRIKNCGSTRFFLYRFSEQVIYMSGLHLFQKHWSGTTPALLAEHQEASLQQLLLVGRVESVK